MTKIHFRAEPTIARKPEVRPVLRFAVMLAIAAGSYATACAVYGGDPLGGIEAKIAWMLDR